MNKFLNSLALFNGLRAVSSGRIPGVKLFYGLIVLLYLIISCKLLFVSVQRESLKQFHLKTKTFSQWALMQLVPSMYNYENEYWYFNYHGWANHYPLRVITFNSYRKQSVDYLDGHLVTIRSRYRSQDLFSEYMIELKNDQLIVEPYEKE